MAIRKVCSHCGETISKGSVESKRTFCNNCDNTKKRREMDEANKQVFKGAGLPEYHCKFCESVLGKKMAEGA